MALTSWVELMVWAWCQLGVLIRVIVELDVHGLVSKRKFYFIGVGL